MSNKTDLQAHQAAVQFGSVAAELRELVSGVEEGLREAEEQVDMAVDDAEFYHRHAAALRDLVSQLLSEQEIEAYLQATQDRDDWAPGPPSNRVPASEAGIDVIRTVHFDEAQRSNGGI